MWNRFRYIHDFVDAGACFTGIEIKGGVNYFLYEPAFTGECKYVLDNNGTISSRTFHLNKTGTGILIRDTRALDIIEKVVSVEGVYYNNKSFCCNKFCLFGDKTYLLCSYFWR